MAAVRKSTDGMTESKVRCALKAFNLFWSELFPAEQSRIIGPPVERALMFEAIGSTSG
jgi:hypothetical protein